MKNLKKAIVVLAVLFAFMTTIGNVSSQATPEIFVTWPGTIEGIRTYEATSIGETFQTNINISNGENIYSWEIKLRFDKSILVVTSATSGGYLSGGPTYALQINNQSNFGYVILGELFDGNYNASGNGTLVEITFKVLEGGRCTLELYDTLLTDPMLNDITHTTQDGTFLLNILTLTPSTGTAAFMIKGYGFANNSKIEEITWNGEQLTVLPEDIDTDSSGNFIAVATVPETAVPGDYSIVARDLPGESASATFTLLSIEGPAGDEGAEGKSAYQIWLDAGNSGTEQDFLDSLKGEAGSAGPGGPMEYSLAAIALSIIAILIAIYMLLKKT